MDSPNDSKLEEVLIAVGILAVGISLIVLFSFIAYKTGWQKGYSDAHNNWTERYGSP